MMRTLLLRSIQAALHAGCRIMQIYNTDFRVWHKHKKSPLDAATCYAQETIDTFLRPTQIPILGEDGKDIPYGTRRSWDVLWLVAPLDGVESFARKSGEFTVNIALVSNQEPVLGVVYAPCMNLLYFTDNNKVSYRLEINTQRAGLLDNELFDVFAYEITKYFSYSKRLPQPQPMARPYTIVGGRPHDSDDLQAYLREKEALVEEIYHIALGSSLKFCVVAEGLADEYPRTGPTMEWDTAAGHAIAKCAGAQVYQTETGLPLLYNKESLTNPAFMVKRDQPESIRQSRIG